MNAQLRDIQLLYGQALYEAQVWKLRAEALGHTLEQAARNSVKDSCVAAFGGEVEEAPVEHSGGETSAGASQQEPATVSTDKRGTTGLLRHSLYVGMQSRVAKSLGVSRSVVCRAMKGNKSSKRIKAALDAEIARIETRVTRRKERAA